MLKIPGTSIKRAHIDRNGNLSLQMNEPDQQYRVLFAFDAVESGELTVQVGDVVTIADFAAAQDGWVLATMADGSRKGFLPEDYVELISATDAAAPSPTAADLASIPVPAAAAASVAAPAPASPWDALQSEVNAEAVSPAAASTASASASPPWRPSAAAVQAELRAEIAAAAAASATASSPERSTPTNAALPSSPIYRANDSRLDAKLAEMIAPARLPVDESVEGASQLTRVLDAGITSKVDFEALIAAHDEWRDRVHEERRHAFDTLHSSLSAVSARMETMQTKSAQTASKLEQLDIVLQEERVLWISRVEDMQTAQSVSQKSAITATTAEATTARTQAPGGSSTAAIGIGAFFD